jgi:hypothetical protein
MPETRDEGGGFPTPMRLAPPQAPSSGRSAEAADNLTGSIWVGLTERINLD